jgi:hypothetical protein
LFASSRICCTFYIDIVCLRFRFLYHSAAREKKFKETFDTEKLKVYDSMARNLEKKVGSLDFFSTLVISQARNSKSTWPFVTVPDFPNRLSKLLSRGTAISLFMSVSVEPKHCVQWEQYASNKNIIVLESLQIMETDKNVYGSIDWNSTVVPVVVKVSDSF